MIVFPLDLQNRVETCASYFSVTYERISLNPTELGFIFNTEENDVNFVEKK
jgi:hypothetical protein